MENVIPATATEGISQSDHRGFLQHFGDATRRAYARGHYAVSAARGAWRFCAQSERVDDEYHLVRGIEYLRRDLEDRADLPLNDPPLGEGLTVLPLWLARCWRGPIDVPLYGHPSAARMRF